MFDQLTRFHEPLRRRAAGGLAVSVLFHLVLLGALLSATDTVRKGSSAPETAMSSPVPVASVETGAFEGAGSAGAGAPGTATEPEGLPPLPPSGTHVALPPIALPNEVLIAANIPRLVPRLPDTLELGRAHSFRLAVPRNRLPEDSVVLLRDAELGISRVRISRAWQASLYGADLVVEPRRPPLQLTDTLRQTEWQWTITPTQPGQRTVFLQIDAPAEVNGQPAVVTLQRVRQEVYVHATPLQRASRFFARHWTWLSLLSIAAALGWARTRLQAA